ncbi:MAG: L-histidine N(alpha)-methyltransferase [Actinomycetota bacterium]|nr:MAG: L-histidine N(alpha)-methyltransferase [Actinomycetota bacterium]
MKLRTHQEFANDVLIGLSQSLKWLPSKYIYDRQGSRLFQEIMELPEYYLTRTEIKILESRKKQICKEIEDEEFNLIELGCGDGKKTKILLEQFLKNDHRFHYFPIDISEDSISEFTDSLKKEFPKLKARGLVSEYFEGLYWLSEQNHRRNVVLFLGSNIGNFTPIKAGGFLSSLWKALNNNDLVLIGFDLKKDTDMMVKAYNDEKGITAAFNKNLLIRINRELKGNFDLDQFEFYATYDVVEGAIQSYLISKKKQEVFIGELKWLFSLRAQEPIHTESSYKYLIEEVEDMANKNNFKLVGNFFDSNKYFVDSLWKVVK